MIQIHICEDSEKQLEQMEKAIRYACAIVSEDMEIGVVTTDSDKLLKHLGESNAINVYFLDIDLKHEKMNGLDVAVKIRENDPVAFICFVTTHSEMSYLTFRYKVMAFDFIIKESYEQLKRDFLVCLKAIDKQVRLLQDNEEKYIKLELFHEEKIIPINSIVAVETIGNHKIRMYTDSQTIDMSRTLSGVKKELPDNFVKCHRSIIVNIDKIVDFDYKTGRLLLKNNMEIYVATRRITEIKEFVKKVK